jgi:hypothetical protein
MHEAITQPLSNDLYRREIVRHVTVANYLYMGLPELFNLWSVI